MPVLRTGIDLIEIDRLEALNPVVKVRFLERVFTPAEQEQAGGSNAFLAGRFAAKEAVAKALGCGIGPVAWKDIEVLRGKGGEPVLRLHGKALTLAEEQGLSTWSLSISHARAYAVAVAIALGEGESGAITVDEAVVIE